MQIKPVLGIIVILLFTGCVNHSPNNVAALDMNGDRLERWVLGDVGQLFFDEKGRLPLTAEEFVAFGESQFSLSKYMDLKITSLYSLMFAWRSEQSGKAKEIRLHWQAPKMTSSSNWAFISLHDNDEPTAEIPRLCAAIRRFVDEKDQGLIMGVEKYLKFTEEHRDSSLSLSSYKDLKYKFLFPGRIRFDWYSEVDAKDKFCVLTFSSSKSEQDEVNAAGLITDSFFEHSDINKDLLEEKLLCDVGRSFFNEKGRLPCSPEEFVTFAKKQFSSFKYKDLKITSTYSTMFDWYSEQTGESQTYGRGYLLKSDKNGLHN